MSTSQEYVSEHSRHYAMYQLPLRGTPEHWSRGESAP